jgi:putative hydrolase of the HAD superfamily
MPFAAVVFDLFGTLIDNLAKDSYRAVLREMSTVLGVSDEQYFQAWVDNFPNRVRGIPPTLEEGIAEACRQLGVEPPAAGVSQAARIRMDYTEQVLYTRPYSLDVLGQVRQQGLKTALVSDCTWEVPALWGETPLAPLFDAVVFSCDEGMHKPDPRMYLLACERLGAEPAECLYVGDGASTELTGAQAVGMTPLQILVPDESEAHYGRAFAQQWNGPVIDHIARVLDYLD